MELNNSAETEVKHDIYEPIRSSFSKYLSLRFFSKPRRPASTTSTTFDKCLVFLNLIIKQAHLNISYVTYIFQKDALMLLKKSTSFLAKMKKGTSEEINVGNEININILTGIGNVMMASSKQADVDVTDEDPIIDRAKVIIHYHYMCS